MSVLLRDASASNEAFERDPRRKQELRMRPIADIIYCNIFGNGIAINRTEILQDATLDREFAIDVTLILSTGQILLGQEKFLSNIYAKYRSITIEYYQNPQTKEHGDWFKLAPQFYFTGYCAIDNKSFDPWIIADWAKIVYYTNNGKILWLDNKNKDGRARASFRYTTMNRLPQDCIIACSWAKP